MLSREARLSRLFAPRSVAILGGSWAANVVEQLQKAGYDGEIWPVHPSRAEMHGIACHASLDALPGPPDAAYVAINRELTVETLQRLREMGAGGAVCFASGFAESESENAGAADLQAALVQAAGDMPVLGPNCYGFCNYLDNVMLWPDQHGGLPVSSGAGIITQSSNLAINLTMQRRGLPMAFIATAGNQAVTGQAQIATHLIDDPRITAIGLHVEGFSNLPAFEELADRARELGKPVVVLKVGRSGSAAAQTVSHTASLAGSAAGASALIERLGFVEVHSLAVFVETLKLLDAHGPLKGNRLGSISCSGGEAALVADLAEPLDIDLPDLTDNQRAGLRAALGDRVALANPLDYHTYVWGDGDRMEATYGAMLGGPPDFAMLVLDWPRPDRCAAPGWDIALERFARAASVSGTPAAIVSTLAENLPEEITVEISRRGLVPLCGIEDGLKAVEAAAIVGRRLDDASPAPLLAAPETLGEAVLLDEAAAKSALAGHGARIPQNVTFEADAASEVQLPPFPLALKAVGLAHKSEMGGVVLGIASDREFQEAVRSLLQLSQTLLAEQMIAGAVCELLVGIVRDPAHGFVLTLGAGGVNTELLRDTQSLLLPVTDTEVETALRRLGVWPLLEGWRGKPAGDVRATIETITSVAEYVAENSNLITEVEINPLIVCERGAFAVDALVRHAQQTGENQ